MAGKKVSEESYKGAEAHRTWPKAANRNERTQASRWYWLLTRKALMLRLGGSLAAVWFL